MIAIKKIWVFLKSYWYVPILIIIALILRNNKAAEILEIANDSHKKQVEAIKSAEIEKKIRSQEIEKEYKNAVSKIEKEYAKINEEVSYNEKAIIKKTIKKFHSNPDALAIELSKKFGVKYVPNKKHSLSNNS